MKNRVSGEIQTMSLLFEISRQLGDALDLKTVLKPVLRTMGVHMNVLRASLTIMNRESGEIFIDESYGLLPEQQARGKYLPGEGITGRVVETGNPVVIPRISEDPQFLDRTGSRREQDKGDISFICVPVKIGSEVIGALSIDRQFTDTASLEDDLRLLTIIASSISQAVRLRQLATEEVDRLRDENRRLQEELRVKHGPSSMIGNSKTMRGVYSLIETVSRTSATVLILGESGVGKESVARSIHYSSDRADRPFVAVNCAALPESLIESELFGHEKGAFTGAIASHKGIFERAADGTVFLDEIGELDIHLQTKLLRVLQEREVIPVGAVSPVIINARLVAATNRDLDRLMAEGRFREDLYYRLNVFPIIVPPLRERRTDILLLADHFVERYSGIHGKDVKSISTPANDLLMAYHWPGNVRELENCIERAVILCTDGVIHSYHLPPSIQKVSPSERKDQGRLRDILEGVEKEIILEELGRVRGNMAQAARNLGITERIMGLRISRFGIDLKKFKE